MPKGRKKIFQTKLTDVLTSDKEGVGTIRKEGDDEYIFLKGVASVAAGSVVVFKEDYTTALLTKALTDIPQRVAVAKAAIVASRWGWFAIRGLHSAAVLASCGADVALYSSGTAGSLDDDSSTQNKVLGIYAGTGVSSAGNTPCFLNYPMSI